MPSARRERTVELTAPSLTKTLIVIAAAILLGLIVDQLFERLFGIRYPILRIVLQFFIIIALIALIDRYIPFDLVSNVFFISIFLAVQQYLFMSIRRVQIWPWPPHLVPFGFTPLPQN